MLQSTANAKLNLYLHIQGKRPDGYHLLESLVVFTAFGDTLRVEAAEALSLDVEGEFADAAGGTADNLVLRAAHALQAVCHVAQGARITLIKEIPVGAGLGGGSADAAAVLKLLCTLWAVIPSREQMQQIALSLGADVAMCLQNKPLIARGIGEELTPLQASLPALHCVLAYPNVALATPAVYGRYQHEYDTKPSLLAMERADSFMASLQSSRNQLQRAAISLAPEVAELLLVLEGYPQAGLVRMCGSGSSCFALVDGAKSAESLANDVARRYPDWWVKATHITPLR